MNSLKERADKIAEMAEGALAHPLLPKSARELIENQTRLTSDMAAAIDAHTRDFNEFSKAILSVFEEALAVIESKEVQKDETEVSP